MRLELLGETLDPAARLGWSESILFFASVFGTALVMLCLRFGTSLLVSLGAGCLSLALTTVLSIGLVEKGATFRDIVMESLTAVGKRERLAAKLRAWLADELVRKPIPKNTSRYVDFSEAPRFVTRAFPNHKPMIGIYGNDDDRVQMMLKLAYGHFGYGLIVFKPGSVPSRSDSQVTYRAIGGDVYAYFD